MHRRHPAHVQHRSSPLLRAIAAGMLLIAVPGAQEIVEDAIHFITDGHTAHDAGHAGEQSSQCCSGPFHACACHAQAVAVLAGETSLLSAHATQRAARTYAVKAFGPGFHTPPFRPPTIAV